MITWIIEPAISLGLFYLVYVLFLRKVPFFQENRLYLLTAILFSLALPLINFSPPVPIAGYTYLIQEVTTAGQSMSGMQSPDSPITFTGILVFIYMAITIALAARLAGRLVQLSRLASGKSSGKYGNARIVSLDSAQTPFSFFNYIFINESLYGKEVKQKILDHEMVHIRQLHSADRLLLEVLVIIQWFNPAAWLCRRSMIEIHEYLADQEVIKRSVSIPFYKSLLLSLQMGGEFFSPANNFSKSLTINRIKMMTAIKPPAWKKTRFFILLPLVLLILMCTKTEVLMTSDDLHQFPVPSVAEMGQDGILRAKEADTIQNEGEVFFIVEEMPDFQGGGQDAFRKFISENLRYPEVAARDNIQGRVFVQFVVKADGSVADATIVRGVHPSLDREAVRVVMSSPRWTPGRQRGEAVNVAFTFPVNFVLQNRDEV
jgi:TonB family protein